MSSVPRGGNPVLRVRLAAETSSVPGARRFVTDGLLDWGRDHLVDDAALCVTEMAANSALHSGSPYVHVGMGDLDQACGSASRMRGLVPLPTVAPPPVPRSAEEAPVEALGTTGRGLAIVSVLAESWGIEERAEGRRIWADVAGDGVEHEVRAPMMAVRDSMTPERGVLPADWATVRMPRCPVQLALWVDQRLDDLIRELQLIDSDGALPRRGSWARSRSAQFSAVVGLRARRRRRDEQALGPGRAVQLNNVHQAIISAGAAVPRAFGPVRVGISCAETASSTVRWGLAPSCCMVAPTLSSCWNL